ncbi:FeoA family protein [Ottowia massiliensis]|jgi:ferrous iron transport protein A|uniref:FeoA family protein n=1 Tax=Ottowia massiliensis TaxID=2045302 RepID=UPI000C831D22|nr:FeoA family protein [Ottowia massiliensis]
MCLIAIEELSVLEIISLPLVELGVKARIVSIVPSAEFGDIDPLVTQRLADLGFSEGMSITLLSRGLLKRGPYAVRLGNLSQFALRRPEAAKIMCRVEE